MTIRSVSYEKIAWTGGVKTTAGIPVSLRCGRHCQRYAESVTQGTHTLKTVNIRSVSYERNAWTDGLKTTAGIPVSLRCGRHCQGYAQSMAYATHTPVNSNHLFTRLRENCVDRQTDRHTHTHTHTHGQSDASMPSSFQEAGT